MKHVDIILNIESIPSNTQPDGVIPCPRVNVFKHPAHPKNILTAGVYNFSFDLEDNGRCGVDVYAWTINKISINSMLPTVSQIVGEKNDQIRQTIHIKDAGTYHINVKIK